MGAGILSIIRTWVPVGVGAALTWLAANLGIVLDDDMSSTAAVVATALVVAAYYALVRALESRWPWFGVLLGAARKPVYVEPVPDAVRSVQARRGY